MDITPKVDTKTNLISGYNQSNIFINKVAYSKKLFLSPNHILEHQIDNIDILKIEDVSWIIDEIETENAQDEVVIIIGCDSGIIPKEIKNELNRRSIGFDLMPSQSAYRTYNILATEDRRIYAILL